MSLWGNGGGHAPWRTHQPGLSKADHLPRQINHLFGAKSGDPARLDMYQGWVAEYVRRGWREAHAMRILIVFATTEGHTRNLPRSLLTD